MNIKTINIGNTEKALENLNEIKNKNYGNVDIKIENIHLKDLNKLIDRTVFKQNDAYINAETLWESMQPIGLKIEHNTHGFTPNNLLSIFESLSNPFCILKTHFNRYTLISSIFINTTRVLTIIEINAPLNKKKNARINKIVTIYPKDRIEKYIGKRTILYIK